MDCVVVRHANGDLLVTEPRKVPKGGLVAVGAAEDGSEGIYVHAEGFLGGRHSANEFGFMQTEVSRERPVDYAVLAQLLGEEKRRGGTILWVVGPALVHARARLDMIWFIENGYANVLLGGNAVAVHDCEAAIFGTTLGMSSSGEGVEGGHALHMRAINAIRRVGSIAAAVEQGLVTEGIMHALVTHHVPFVLALLINAGLFCLIIWPNLLNMGTEETALLGALCLGGIVLLVGDFYALSWVGMRMGLRINLHRRAILATFAQVMLPSWLGVLVLLFIMGSGGFGAGMTMAATAVWLSASLVLDLLLAVRAKTGLLLELRPTAGSARPAPA